MTMRIHILLFAMVVVGLQYTTAYAQISQPTSVLAAGGTTASGSGYTARGTMGQTVTGLNTASPYANGAGYWFLVQGFKGSPLPAVTRYVALTGTDSGNGCTNPATPCATIAYAVSQANNGDTISVAAGSYNEPGLLIDKQLRFEGQGVIVR